MDKKVDEEKANQTLQKLLSSEDANEVAVGLNLLATLAQQKVKTDEAHITKAITLTTEGENEHVRSQALSAVCAIKQPVPLDILRKTAKDKDATVRMLTAYALADKKLGKEAERLITALVTDKDQRVLYRALSLLDKPLWPSCRYLPASSSADSKRANLLFLSSFRREYAYVPRKAGGASTLSFLISDIEAAGAIRARKLRLRRAFCGVPVNIN
ncbi:unnamed protein product, partial [marine sediment metagenome]